MERHKYQRQLLINTRADISVTTKKLMQLVTSPSTLPPDSRNILLKESFFALDKSNRLINELEEFCEQDSILFERYRK